MSKKNLLIKILLSITFFYNIRTDLIIKGPKELRDSFENKPIKTADSNFGFNPYGFILSGIVNFSIDNKNADLACDLQSLTEAFKQISVENKKNDLINILLVDRGDCHFVDKARNAQTIGAKALIVVNKDDSDLDNFVMSDDGTGKEITIPVLMITKSDGEKLKGYYKSKGEKQIVIDIDFQIETNSKVDFEVLFSSDSTEIYELFYEFEQYEFFEKLGKKINFKPYFVSYPHPDYNPSSSISIDNCLYGGKYCGSAYKSSYSSEDLDILLVNIYQYCVYNSLYLNKTNDYSYFYTMIEYNFFCLQDTSKNSTNLECMKSIISTTEIESCFNSNYNSTSTIQVTDSTVLSNGSKFKNSHGIKIVPTILINNRIIRGDLSAKEVIEALCAGIIKKPEVCFTNGGFSKKAAGKKTLSIVILICGLVLGISVIIFFLCRKYIAEKVKNDLNSSEIDTKVNSVVTHYLALKEKN